MPVIAKQDADAYDRIIDAAADLADLIEADKIEVDEYVLEELTIFLAGHAPLIRDMFRKLKMTWP